MNTNGRQFMQVRADVAGKAGSIETQGTAAVRILPLYSRSWAFIRGWRFFGGDLGLAQRKAALLSSIPPQIAPLIVWKRT